jgi:predicted nucleotidyltransferase
MNDTPLPAALVQRHEQVATLCRRFGVERLEVFGSAAEGRFDPGRSDYDFIARFSPTATPGVDLLSDAPIRNPYFRQAVDASRRVVYECAAEQASA